MQIYFKTKKEVELFLSKLLFCICPHCGRTGSMIRHGFLDSLKGCKKSRIRGWRIRCKGCNSGTGVDRTWSLKLGNILHRRWFSAKELWAFIRLLLKARSIKQAWEAASFNHSFPSSLSTAYKVLTRLGLCQTVLRTMLSSRGPPPVEKTGVPLFQVFAHLKKVFGVSAAATAYQLSFQRDFLAVT